MSKLAGETMRIHTAASTTSNGSTNSCSESVKVIVRCRPLSSTETKQGHNELAITFFF